MNSDETQQPDEIQEEPKEPQASSADLMEPGGSKHTEFGLIRHRGLETEMEEAYLDYAMSVIVSRALPDVRDGLKPVHRRILYVLHENGLRSTVKYRKSATIVGDVLGKYHPHGDSAVYDSMVRMAQSFSMRYPLVDGQGNFGSIDGDSAAAYRYTEARMTAFSEELLADIDKETVAFLPNYDGTREEPAVLPAKAPNLLLNGALGIAVGMATNIPPHNLSELADAVKLLIDQPEATIDDLMQHIKGPDFPTGGMIYSTEDIKNTYATGRGKIVMRGITEIVEKKKGFQIVISAIPYQVNKAELIKKMAELVKTKKIEGIADIRDESDREEGVRVVIELKSTAFPKKILNQLYASTPLESAFHVNMIALVDGLQPRILTLKQVLDEFIRHRMLMVRRRTEFDLKKAQARAHILEGLKKALDHIDAIINTIRQSANREVAQKNLMKTYEFSELQAQAILEMRLAALAALERQRIDDELKEKLALIAALEAILASENKIKSLIQEEMDDLKIKYGDERRTQVIAHAASGFKAEDLIPNEQVIVTLTRGGYIKRVPVSSYRSQHRGGKGSVGMTTKEEDIVDHLLTTWTHNDIMLFTNLGRLFITKVYELPSVSRQAKGQALPNVIQIGPDEQVTTVLSLDQKTRTEGSFFFMGTEKGIVKKTKIEAYQHVRKHGLIAVKLREGDTLRWVAITSGQDRILMASSAGQAILFSESDVRPMGRSASGVTGMRLRKDDHVISMTVLAAASPDEESARPGRKPAGPTLMSVLENGYGKRTSIDEFHGQRRGGYGVKTSRVTSKTGRLVTARVVWGDEGDLLLVSKKGILIRIPTRSVKRLKRDTQGVRLMRLKAQDKVASVALIRKDTDLGSELGEELAILG